MKNLFDWPVWADDILLTTLTIAVALYIAIEIYEMIKSRPKH